MKYLFDPFYYCDIYPEKDNIGDAFKWCEGANYENEDGKKYYEV